MLKRIILAVMLIKAIGYADLDKNFQAPQKIDNFPIDTVSYGNSFNFSYSKNQQNKIKADIEIENSNIANDKNYNDSIKETINTANIGFSTDVLDLTIGRQPIKLDWVNNSYDAIVGILKFDNLKITGAYTQSDEMKAFTDINTTSQNNFDTEKYGTYFIDAKYDISKYFKTNFFYLSHSALENRDTGKDITHSQNGSTAIGTKLQAYIKDINIAIKYLSITENNVATPNGHIINTEFKYSPGKISITTGFTIADKDLKLDNLSIIKDKADMSQPGSLAYIEANAKISTFDIQTLYKVVNYDNLNYEKIRDEQWRSKETEIKFAVNKKLAKNLKAGVQYSNLSTTTNNYRYLLASINYLF